MALLQPRDWGREFVVGVVSLSRVLVRPTRWCCCRWGLLGGGVLGGELKTPVHDPEVKVSVFIQYWELGPHLWT